MSSSSEIWRHLPSLFHNLTFGKTNTVIEQLKSSSRQNLTSLRLVGVEGNWMDVEALSDALHKNTTLQQVSICGTFLATIPDIEARIRLFQAIGSLPNLTHLTLQGNEDSEAFPVEALIRLLQANNQSGLKLQEIVCQYVDFLVPSPSSVVQLGVALQNSLSLKKVQWLGIEFIPPNNGNNNPAEIIRLDAVVASLRRCDQIELGLRHRLEESNISSKALQLLLAPPFSRVRKLSLKRRIIVDATHLSTILSFLCQQPSVLTELELGEINLQTSDTTLQEALWSDLATVLGNNNTCLQVLDLHFLSGNMSVAAEQAIANALRHNTVLRSLSLLGAMQSHCSLLWLDLIENYNYTLEELDLGASVNNEKRAKLQFFLELNRQPVLESSTSSCGGLRKVMREYNGAIPPRLVEACVEAALKVGRDDTIKAGFPIDEDELWYVATCLDESTDGLAALFYLFSQQPSLLLYLQQRMLLWEEHQRLRKELQREQAAKGSIPIGGASPQLMLLDDDIVALW